MKVFIANAEVVGEACDDWAVNHVDIGVFASMKGAANAAMKFAHSKWGGNFSICQVSRSCWGIVEGNEDSQDFVGVWIMEEEVQP